MTREEYKALLEREIYGSKKRTWSERRWLREKNPSTNAVYLIRRMQYYAALPGALARRRARSACVALARRYNMYVGDKTEIGEGVSFPHPTSIVLGQAVQIGEKCKIFQGVTVGSSHNGDFRKGLQPHIGRGVTLFSGCAVIGAVQLGDGVTIGANAVMTKSAPAGTVWAGVPARQIVHAAAPTENEAASDGAQ